MKILGIESSCDETAAAVVQDGHVLLSNVVNSQIDIHAVYGGVVPEVAARSHIEVINPVINQALSDANVTWDDIDAIAVTYAPGLVGSLLVGTLAARTLAVLKNKPLYPIHHVEAHVYANFLNENPPEFPLLALIVSGNHTQLVLFRDHGDYELLGHTQDDAVGEALNGNPKAHKLPKAKMSGVYDFSFSGLKTAVLRAVQREVGVELSFPSHKLPELLNDVQRANFAASFQHTAVETLVDAAERAYHEYAPKSVVIAGGVAANLELRRVLSERLPLQIDYAPIELCTDNGAMVATLGYYYAQKNSPTDPFEVEVQPVLSMTKTTW